MGKLEKSTKPIPSLNPTWDETFIFPLNANYFNVKLTFLRKILFL